MTARPGDAPAPPHDRRAGPAGGQRGFFPISPALLSLALLLGCTAYDGLVHDAQLYAGQAVNRATGGALANDLFFRHGSQDRFSLFSAAAGPLVAAWGLRPAFAVGYWLSAALFLAGAVALAVGSRPTGRRAVAVVALAAVAAVAPFPYGGLGVFVVRETFLTARLPASALALLALAAWLGRRPLSAGALVVTAGLFHPLMAAPAVGVMLLDAAGALAPRRQMAAVIVLSSLSIAGAALLPGAEREWIEAVRRLSRHCLPSEWDAMDWLRIAATAALLLLPTGERRWDRLARAAAVVHLLGAGLTVLGEVWAKPFLVQLQPYRAQWLAAVLATVTAARCLAAMPAVRWATALALWSLLPMWERAAPVRPSHRLWSDPRAAPPLEVFLHGHARPAIDDLNALLAPLRRPDRRLTVYWPGAYSVPVWTDLDADGYVSFIQVQGALFARGTLTDATRRLDAAGPWEWRHLVEAWGLPHMPEPDRRRFGGLIREDRRRPPNVEDVAGLFADPALDVLVSPGSLDALPPGVRHLGTAGGFWHVYGRR